MTNDYISDPYMRHVADRASGPGPEEDPEYLAWCEEMEHPTATCPEDGEQDVVGAESTGGPDPYAIDVLACGHRVLCMGPGEPYTIVGAKRAVW